MYSKQTMTESFLGVIWSCPKISNSTILAPGKNQNAFQKCPIWPTEKKKWFCDQYMLWKPKSENGHQTFDCRDFGSGIGIPARAPDPGWGSGVLGRSSCFFATKTFENDTRTFEKHTKKFRKYDQNVSNLRLGHQKLRPKNSYCDHKPTKSIK